MYGTAVSKTVVVRPPLQGHTIGIMDTSVDCDAAILALQNVRFATSQIQMFLGTEGVQSLRGMMIENSWGESAGEYLRECIAELNAGHSVVSVEVRDSDEAVQVASIISEVGGHGVYHFGLVVDTRLTA